MTIEFKPNLSDIRVIGMQVMQQWSKHKIIHWWDTYPEYEADQEYKKKLMNWLTQNLDS